MSISYDFRLKLADITSQKVVAYVPFTQFKSELSKFWISWKQVSCTNSSDLVCESVITKLVTASHSITVDACPAIQLEFLEESWEPELSRRVEKTDFLKDLYQYEFYITVNLMYQGKIMKNFKDSLTYAMISKLRHRDFQKILSIKVI